MAVTSLSKNSWTKFLNIIKSDYPDISFTEAEANSFSARDNTIYYCRKADFITEASSLLHELGHLIKGHRTYQTDMELLVMESEAWQTAEDLAKNYNLKINNDYMQDCLDSYRDWLHKRSTCPKCHQNGIQTNKNNYLCINCQQKWQVSDSRFCRTYRRKK